MDVHVQKRIVFHEVTGLRDYEITRLRDYEITRLRDTSLRWIVPVLANHCPLPAFSHFKLLYLMDEVSDPAMLVLLSSHWIVLRT